MTAPPSRDSSGTTWTISLSRTAHVSVRSYVSPMRTAPALVRHQHLMGSTWTICSVDGAGCCADPGEGRAAPSSASSHKHRTLRCVVHPATVPGLQLQSVIPLTRILYSYSVIEVMSYGF